MTLQIAIIIYLLGMFITVWLYDWLEYLIEGTSPLTPDFTECLFKLIVSFFWPILAWWYLLDFIKAVKKWRKSYLEQHK